MQFAAIIAEYLHVREPHGAYQMCCRIRNLFPNYIKLLQSLKSLKLEEITLK
jgi:hypothetical protein